jgi:hypothetical protein
MTSSAIYQPYFMDDMRRMSAQGNFTAVSMFANVGGSCVGYSIRTHKVNIPYTVVDTHKKETDK